MMAAYGVVEKETNDLVSVGFIVSDCYHENESLIERAYHARMPIKT